MKGTRFNRWMSVLLSVMLVMTLFPMHALADDGDAPVDPSEPSPTPVTIAIVHTVTFVDWDNSVLRVEEVEDGKSATAPTHPDRKGFVADGWDKEFSNVVDDMTVTALYRVDDKNNPNNKEVGTMALKYTVTIHFSDKNGIFLQAYSMSGISQSDFDKFKNKKGADFVNTLAGVFHENFLEISSFGDGDFKHNNDLKLSGGGFIYTIFAQLNRDFNPAYEIRYVSTSGATIKSIKDTGNLGQLVTGTADSVTGYTPPFLRLKTMILTATGNLITFTYTPITYKIQYNLNGGTVSGNPTSYTIETPTFTLNNPTRVNYTFVKWNPEDATIEKGTTGDLSFSAVWTPLTFKIDYDYQGGTVVTANPSSYTPFSPKIVLLPSTRDGYTFAGWSDGGVIPAGSNGDKSFTASWTPIAYNILYDLGGGIASGNPSTYTIETPTFTLNAPTRDYYSFDGWDKLGGIVAQGSTGELKFTALWKPIDYAITYNLGEGGVNADTNPGSYTVETPTFTLANPTREHYEFVSWGTDDITIALGSHGAREFTAIWAPVNYSITYNLGGGAASGNPDTYNIETPTFTLNAPTRDHYTFVKWDPEDATIEQGTTGDLSFTAVWSVDSYNIKYNLNGGTNPDGNPASYTFENLEITLLDPSRAGYTFTGWTPTNKIPAGSFGDKEFTATWRANIYSITYIMNSGTNNPANPKNFTPDSAEITLLNPTRTGYDFAGWTPSNKIPAGTTTAQTFTAIWTAHAYTITYVLGGGSNSTSNPATYTITSGRIALQPATKEGYTFVRWTPNNGVITAGSTGNKTFTAVWTPTTYRISYTLNDGFNSTDNPYFYNIESETITLSNPYRTGYNFAGWTPDGVILKGSTGDKSFTASWTPKVYNITYQLNGGINSDLNPASYTIETDTIHLANPTRPGYSFMGWVILGFMPWDTVPKGSVGDWAFTAVWSPIPIRYDITYVLGGGKNNTNNPTGYRITSGTINLLPPTRDGYTFAGWTPDGVIPTGSTGDKQFTASWTPIVYQLTYELFGGEATNPASYTIETPTFTLNSPTREHYIFAGWSPANATITQGSTGDKTFTASWTAGAYEIKYNLDGGSVSGNPASYTIETPTITLNAPTRDYYTFVKWTPDDGVIPMGSTGDKEFTAVWTPVVYQLTYELSGGAATNPVSYTIETPTFSLNTPTREHYTFAGWDPAESTIALGSTGDKHFKAIWTADDFDITYNLGGGSVSGNPDTYTIETPTITLNTPTRDYYTFVKWTPDDGVIPMGSTGDKEFTAVWAPVSYKIDYDLKGGVNAIGNRTSYTVETEDFTIAAPTRLGYDFLGWNPTDTSIETGSHGDLKFTAMWSDPIAYKVNYVLGGGINAPTNPASYTVESDTITLAPPTRAGYNFTGWTPAGTIPKGSTGEVTFTATWSAPIVYPITYTMNGGVNAGANPASYTVVTPTINLAAPTRLGYTFTGWTPAGNIALGSTGARAFTANWSAPIPYDITYVLGGGVNSTANPATYNITSGEITLLNPTRTGYDFLGWTPDGVIPAASTGDRTFTARWSEVHVHTVTYYVTGGTQAGLDGATPFAVYENVAYGTPVPIPDDPAETEYTFDGWTSEVPATMPDQDVVLYGTLTKLPVLQEIINNEKTPLAAPSWSLLNLIFAALTALGVGSIVNMLLKKRNGIGSRRSTLFSLLTLIPAAGAIVVFLLTQAMSGNMVFADKWSVLLGGVTLVQGALVALGIKKA